MIAIRRQSTSAAQAPLLARMWLGGEAASFEVAGHSGWRSGCERLPTRSLCRECIAVLVGRRFIIVKLAPREADYALGQLTLADLPGIVDRLERLDAAQVEP